MSSLYLVWEGFDMAGLAYVLVVFLWGGMAQVDGPYTRSDCLADMRQAYAMGIDAACYRVTRRVAS